MNLNDHIESIVNGIVDQITANVVAKVDGIISNTINNRLATYDISEHVQKAAVVAFEKKVSEYTIDPKKLETRIVDKINQTISSVESQTKTMISNEIHRYVSEQTFQQSLNSAVGAIVSDSIKEITFPEKSISASSINFDGAVISGNVISGGLIKNFSSTGIDDMSNQVAITILDDITVVENNLLTRDLTVEGTVKINGNLQIEGDVDCESGFYKRLVDGIADDTLTKMNDTLFTQFSDTVFDKIREDGIDLTKVTFNGDVLIRDNVLGARITESNLQRLGVLRELQVSGETLLGESIYATKGRLGVNTIEPSSVLAVWDDEVEVTISKRQKDTGSIGTPRNQRLVLSSNNKDNIVLDTDGSVEIRDLKIGSIRFTSSETPPSVVSNRGHIVWNANPNPGGPIGWVCLGGANWANFGIID